MNKEPIPKQKIDDTDNKEIAPTQVDSTHPFDKKAFVEFIKKTFPNFNGDLESANRPKTSDNPDELESWEAKQILKRKLQQDWEENLPYLARLLYEEFFSVNQEPHLSRPKEFQGVFGLTPGGLISHFYTGGKTNHFGVEEILELKPGGENIKEAMELLKQKGGNSSESYGLLSLVLEISYPTTFNNPNSSMNEYLKNGIRNRVMRGHWSYPEELDSIGFRLIRMLLLNPEMMEEIKDEYLKQLLGHNFESPLLKVDFLKRFWNQCSSALLDNGAFKNPAGNEKEEILKTIEKMLIVRTHPEMQIFFKYLSPSGYINSKKDA